MEAPEQNQPETFAYLDHNVLDAMTKGDPMGVRDLLKRIKLTPVYSDESLKEIHRSNDYEHTFLDLLEGIGAKYIETELDQNFQATGSAIIHSVSAKAQYEHFISQQAEDQEGDFGLSDILLKLHGGKPDISFADVFDAPIANAMRNLLTKLDDLDPKDMPEEMRSHIETVRALAPELPAIMKGKTASMVAELNGLNSSPAASFASETGIGPAILNNLNPPRIVQQVWELVSSHMDAPGLDLESFFGLKPQPYSDDPERELTPQEKVNAIYHQLNFLGYYRDSKVKKESRFRASLSDMTHAGMAAFCHVFICRDADLVMKAKAAYEHLGIKTLVVFYPSEKQIGSNMLLQFGKYRA